ncbi:MAG: hypothetical protein IKY14_07600, partial [Erysipelotrichaceae bacterium]|nr:hypothetical protein [Erysipelotrichaceae bacterium]
ALDTGEVEILISYPEDHNYEASATKSIHLNILALDIIFEMDSYEFREGAVSLPAGAGNLYMNVIDTMVSDYEKATGISLSDLIVDDRLLLSTMGNANAKAQAFLEYFGLTVPSVTIPSAIRNYSKDTEASKYLLYIHEVDYAEDSIIKDKYGIQYVHGQISIERRDVTSGDYGVYVAGTNEPAQLSPMGWYKDQIDLVPEGDYTEICVLTGDQTLENATWTDHITLTQSQNQQMTIYLRNPETGVISEKAVLLVRIDLEKPTLEIEYNETPVFETSVDNEPIRIDQSIFGALYNTDFEVVPHADDNVLEGVLGSGIDYLEYVYLDVKTAEDAANLENRLASATWTAVKYGELPVLEEEKPSGIYFVRVYDYAGNVSEIAQVTYFDGNQVPLSDVKHGAYFIDQNRPVIVLKQDEEATRHYFDGQWRQYVNGIPALQYSISDSRTGIASIEWEVTYYPTNAMDEGTKEVKSAVVKAPVDQISNLNEVLKSENFNIPLNELFNDGSGIAKDGIYVVYVKTVDNSGYKTEMTRTLKKDNNVPDVTLTSDKAETNKLNDVETDANKVEWHQSETLTFTVHNYETIQSLSGLKTISLLTKVMNETTEQYASDYAVQDVTLTPIDGTGAAQIVIEIKNSGQYQAKVVSNAFFEDATTTNLINPQGTVATVEDTDGFYETPWIDAVTPVLVLSAV